ncbi:hypothetical protein GF318_06155 [Candidatus Micrarchaeota archaeon]|nr:hypothetical protein [Candidatus Micrarchaeota archaeon]
MASPRCPKCGKELESSDIVFTGMAVRCGDCGYDGPPLKTGDSYYEMLKKRKSEEAPSDFEIDMSLSSIFFKMALVSLFAFIISLYSIEMKEFTIAAFIGFILFSAFHFFARNGG